MAGTIPADHLMIVAAFRYCLGRQTYIVSSCTDWLIENWSSIPDNTRGIIERDLEEAFADDDRDRANGDAFCRLGADFDRGAWASVRRLYRNSTCVQCGNEASTIEVIHRDGEVTCPACYDPNCVTCGKPIMTGQTFIPAGRKMRHPWCVSETSA